MDSLEAYSRGFLARSRNERMKVFDWDKAALLILKKKAKEAAAGLKEDWEWTGGIIFQGGKPVFDDYTYLSSNWATPTLLVDNDYIPCWIYEERSPGWDNDTKWPDLALKILGYKKSVSNKD